MKYTNRVHRLPITLHTALVKIQLQRLKEGGRGNRPSMAGLFLEMMHLGMLFSKGEKPSPDLLEAELKKSGGVTVSVSILLHETTQSSLKKIARNGRQLSETALGLIIVALKR